MKRLGKRGKSGAGAAELSRSIARRSHRDVMNELLRMRGSPAEMLKAAE